MPIHLHNYFTPLTSQVEELSSPLTDHLCTSWEITHDTQHRPYRPQQPKQVYFYLAPSHTDKDSRTWTQSEWTTLAPPRSLRHLQLHDNQIKQGVLNGSIPSAAWDTACTSNARKVGGPLIPTALQSNKVFALANGHPTPTTTVASRRLCLRRATVVTGVGWPSARSKTLLDWSAVGMNGPLTFPEFEVHAVSHAAEGMDPLRNPCLIRCSCSCRWWSERGGARVVHWDCFHVREYLSVWDGAR